MTTDTFELPPPGSDAEFYALANQAGLTYQQAKIALQYARQAVLMERERCAKKLEWFAGVVSGPNESDGHYELLNRIAAAIRKGTP